MTRRAAGVLLALLACSTFAEADMTTPDGKDRNLPCARDGVYWKEPPPGRAVPFRERHLYSVANPNDRYTLTVIAPPQTERHEALLCLGGRVLGERSWGGDSTAAYFDFHLSRSEADAVAAALHLERRDRRPLGQGLKWQFRLKDAQPRVGQALSLVFRLENHGPEPVGFSTGGAYRGSGRDNRFTFVISRDGAPEPDIGTSQNFGGKGMTPVLRPGESHEQTIDLKSWAAFARPGEYEVRCAYELDLEVPHEPRSWAFAHERWAARAEETIRITLAP